MNRLVRACIVIVILWAATQAVFDFQDWSWNQRLVLEVDTPHGAVTGGAVVRIDVGSTRYGGSGDVTEGEASFVEIAPGKYLFALLDKRASQIASSTFVSPDDFKAKQEWMAVVETVRATQDVPRKEYPLLVTFTDINDPATVRKVDPSNLAGTFGPGVSLRRVTLEITDETVTKNQITEVLGWLSRIGDARLDGRPKGVAGRGNRLATELSALNFERD